MILLIRAVTGSRKTGFEERLSDGSFKVKLKAPAEKGRANTELLKWLANEFGIPTGSLSFVSGTASRMKRIRVDSPVTIPNWYYD